MQRVTARLVEIACFVERPQPSTIKGAVVPPPPTPRAPRAPGCRPRQPGTGIAASCALPARDYCHRGPSGRTGPKGPREGDLRHRLAGNLVNKEPNQGSWGHRGVQKRRHPPIDRVLAPGVPNRFRERAAAGDHQTRRNGVLDPPPGNVNERGDKDDGTAYPNGPREHPPRSPRITRAAS